MSDDRFYFRFYSVKGLRLRTQSSSRLWVSLFILDELSMSSTAHTLAWHVNQPPWIDSPVIHMLWHVQSRTTWERLNILLLVETELYSSSALRRKGKTYLVFQFVKLDLYKALFQCFKFLRTPICAELAFTQTSSKVIHLIISHVYWKNWIWDL